MKILSTVKSLFSSGRKAVSKRDKGLENWQKSLVRAAALDSGLDLPELRSEFSGQAMLGPVSSTNTATRRRVTNAFLGELAKNSFLRGMMTANTNMVVGTGPRLQLLREVDGSVDTAGNRDIERDFMTWANEVDVPGKIRLAYEASVGQGESFIFATNNPVLITKTLVGLDLEVIEGALVDDPEVATIYDQGAGGIKYDTYGNPVSYPIRSDHPNDRTYLGHEVTHVSADYVCHLFREARPGQLRGMSDVLPALPLFALHRRMQTATLGVVESSANVTAVIESDIPQYMQDDPNLASGLFGTDPEDAWETYDISSRMMMCLPAGAKVKPFPTGQPNSQYDTFERSVIREIARCINMPFNIAAGDSSGYNYASGRLDHQSYHQQIGIERQRIECTILNKVFNLWLTSYLGRKFGILPEEINYLEYKHKWFWDAPRHVDPLKEAKAARERVAMGLSSLSSEIADEGRDIDEEHASSARDLGYGDGPEAVQAFREDLRKSLLNIDNSSVDEDDDDEDSPRRIRRDESD